MLTIADIPLPISPELERFAYSLMDPDDAWALEPPAWPSPPSHLGQFQFAPRWVPARRMRINRIVWPMWGMSRWAYGCFLMHATQIDDLRDVAYDRDTGQANPVTIRMRVKHLTAASEFNADSISFDKMYLLPPRIISRTDPPGGVNAGESSQGLYLQPVVDERYFLNDPFVNADDAVSDACDMTWDEAYELAAERAGFNLEFESTPSFEWDDIAGTDAEGDDPATGYRVAHPHPDLFHRAATIGLLFDSIASCVGHRIVAYPSMSWARGDHGGEFRYYAMSWSTSLLVREDRRRKFAERGTRRGGGGPLFPEVP